MTHDDGYKGESLGSEAEAQRVTVALDALGDAERISAPFGLEARITAASLPALQGASGSGTSGVSAPASPPARRALLRWGLTGTAAAAAVVLAMVWTGTPHESDPARPPAAQQHEGGAEGDGALMLAAFESFDDSFTMRMETLRAEAVAVRAGGWSSDVEDLLLMDFEGAR